MRKTGAAAGLVAALAVSGASHATPTSAKSLEKLGRVLNAQRIDELFEPIDNSVELLRTLRLADNGQPAASDQPVRPPTYHPVNTMKTPRVKAPTYQAVNNLRTSRPANTPPVQPKPTDSGG